MNKESFHLTYLSTFEEDLNQIVDYITYTLKNPNAAKRLVNDIERAIITRLKSPLSFAPYRSFKKRKYTYYRINVHNFSIFYVVNQNKMEIRRILYNKRNLDKFL